MNHRIQKFALLLVILWFSIGVEKVCAQPGDREFELKAVWLYQFGNKLISWQGQTREPFVIGVYGSYPGDLEDHLGTITERNLRIQGRRVVIEQYENVNDLTDDNKPDILFISRSGPNGETAQQRVEKAKEIFRNRPVLLVGDQNNIESHTAISFRINPNDRRLMIRDNTRVLPNGVSLREPEIWRGLSNRELVSVRSTVSSNSRE